MSNRLKKNLLYRLGLCGHKILAIAVQLLFLLAEIFHHKQSSLRIAIPYETNRKAQQGEEYKEDHLS
jgi:hypothetical protein